MPATKHRVEPKNYLKNVVKSVAFAAADVSKSMMPNTSEFIDDNKSFLASTYATIRNPKATLKKSVNAFQQSKMFQAVDYGVRNIAEDLRTGNFYNKQREEQDQARLMGFDMGDLDDLSEFGISDNWEEELDASFKKNKNKDTGISAGEAKIVDSVEKTAAAQSAATVNAVVSMGNYQVKAARTNLGVIFNQNEKLFGGLHTDISTLNTTMTAMHNLQAKALTNIDKNLASFFELSQKYQAENNAMLKEMLEIQRNLYQSAEEKDKKARASSGRTTWRDINNNGMPNLDAYFKQVQKNIKADLSMFDFGEDSNVLATMLSSPLKYITQAMVGGIIPGTIKAAAKELDQSLSGVFASFIAEMSNNRGEMGIMGQIAKYLGVDTSVNRRIDTSKYEKGPVPWDGMSRKALMDVIPGYLSRMESYLTGGPEMIYDYKNGKWITMKAVHNQYNNIHKYSKERALGNMPEDIKKDIQANYTSTNDQYADTLSKAYEEFGEWFYEHNGRINPNKGPGDNGVNRSKYPNLYLHFNKFARAFKNYQSAEVVQGGRRVNRTAYSKRNLSADILDAKQMENEAFADADSAMRTYYSARKIGFDVYGKWDGGKFTGKNMLLNTVDNLNNNIFDYLQKIARELQWQREYGFSSGGGKGNKGGGGGKNKNASKFDSISLQASGATANRNKASQYLANRLSNEEDYYLREAALSAIENKDFQAIANSKEARELLVEIYKAKKDNDSQKMADLINDHDGGLIDSFVTKYLWNSNVESISEAQIRTKMEQAARDGGKKAGIISRVKQGAKRTGSLMGGVVEAGVEWLYAADKAIYKLLFETSIKDDSNNKQYDGFMDYMKGKFNDFWGSLKEGFTNTFIDPIKKALGIDDSFKQRFKESAKNTASGVWNQFKNANKEFYGDIFNSVKDINPAQELEKRKAADREKRLNTANVDKAKLEKILKQEDAFYDPNFQAMLKDYGLNPADYNNIDEARQALSSKIDEIINSNRSNAKGTTVGKPYAGITSLGKGEVVADEDGLHKVVKTGIYNLEKLSHIINTEDANELGLSPGPKVTVADTMGREKLAWKNALTSHAEGTIDLKPKEILEEAKKNIPEMAGSGLVGGILSMVLGLAGGPLVGAAVGAGTSLIKRSDFLKNKLFGEEKDGQREGGLISRTVQDAVKKYAPDMMKGSMVGLIPGLLISPLGPIGGIMIGGAIGMLKNTQAFQDRFLNKKNKDGSNSDKNILGIGNKEKEIINKLLPAGLKGAGTGAVVGIMIHGPFGLLGNAALGAGLGMLSSSEEFKNALLGDKLEDGSRVGGVIGVIKDAFEPLKEAMNGVKDKLINTIDEAIITPMQKFMQPIIHLLPTLSSMLGRAIGRLTKELGKKIHKNLATRMTKLVRRVSNSKILGTPFRIAGKLVRAPGALIGGIGDRVRRFEIAHGNNSGMTNQEAQDWMESHGWGDRVYKYMRAANMVGREGGLSIEDAESLRNTLKTMNVEEAGAQKKFNDANRKLNSVLTHSGLSNKSIDDVIDAAQNGNLKSLMGKLADQNGNMTEKELKQKYPELAAAMTDAIAAQETLHQRGVGVNEDKGMQEVLGKLGLRTTGKNKNFDLSDKVARNELLKQLGLSIEGTGGKQDKSLTPEGKSAEELESIHNILKEFMKVYMANMRGDSEAAQQAAKTAQERLDAGMMDAQHVWNKRRDKAEDKMEADEELSSEASDLLTRKGSKKVTKGKKNSTLNAAAKAGKNAWAMLKLDDQILRKISNDGFKLLAGISAFKALNFVQCMQYGYPLKIIRYTILKIYGGSKKLTGTDIETLCSLGPVGRKQLGAKCNIIDKNNLYDSFKITNDNKDPITYINEMPIQQIQSFTRAKEEAPNNEPTPATGNPPMNYRGTIQGIVDRMPKHPAGTIAIGAGLEGLGSLGGIGSAIGSGALGVLSSVGPWAAALIGANEFSKAMLDGRGLIQAAKEAYSTYKSNQEYDEQQAANAAAEASKQAELDAKTQYFNNNKWYDMPDGSKVLSTQVPTSLKTNLGIGPISDATYNTLTNAAPTTLAPSVVSPTQVFNNVISGKSANTSETADLIITGAGRKTARDVPTQTLDTGVSTSTALNATEKLSNLWNASTTTTSLGTPTTNSDDGEGGNNNNKKKGTGIIGKGISLLNGLRWLKGGGGQIANGIGSAIGGIGSLLGGALGGLGNLLGFGDNGGDVSNTSIMMPMFGDMTGGNGGLSVSGNGGSDFDETDQAGDGRDVVQLLPGRFGYVKRDSSGNVEPDTTDSRTREIMNDLQKQNDSTSNSEKATTKMYNMLKGLLPDNNNQKEHPLLKLLYGSLAIYTLVKSGALKTFFDETIRPLWEGTEDFIGIKPWFEEKWVEIKSWLDENATIQNALDITTDSTLGKVLAKLGFDVKKGESATTEETGYGSYGRGGIWGRALVKGTTTSGGTTTSSGKKTTSSSGGILSSIGNVISGVISNSRIGQIANSLLGKKTTTTSSKSTYNKDSNGYFDFTNNGPESTGVSVTSYNANASTGAIAAGTSKAPTYTVSEGGVLKDEIFTDAFWEPKDLSKMGNAEKLRYAATRMAKIMQAPAMLIDYSLRAFESSISQLKAYVMGMYGNIAPEAVGAVAGGVASNGGTVENTADVTRGYNATNYIAKTLDPLYKSIKKGQIVKVGIEDAKQRQENQLARYGLTAKGKYGKGYVKQIDPSIAGRRFNVSGDSGVQTIGDSACGPAAAVNAVKAAYGMGNPLLGAVDYALNGGYKEIDGGTYPEFFSDYFADAGLNSVTTTSKSALMDNIKSGMPTVLMGQDNNGVSANTPYGTMPHYVTATGVDNSGHVIIQDPESRYDNQLYSMNDVLGKTSFGVSATGLYGFGKYGRGKYGRGKKVVIVGDSRTAGMCDAVNGTHLWQSFNLGTYTDASGNYWIFGGGWSISSMKNGFPGYGGSMLPYIDQQAGPNTAICIWMGTNDVTQHTESNYISWLPQWAKGWQAKGAEVYFVSVGPSYRNYYNLTNDAIEKFNATIKAGLQGTGIGYLDVWTPTKDTIIGYNYIDPIHYNNEHCHMFWELICKLAAAGGASSGGDSTGSNGNKKKTVKEEPSIGGVLAGIISNSRAGKMLASLSGSSNTNIGGSTEESDSDAPTTSSPTLLGNSSNKVTNSEYKVTSKSGSGKFGRGKGNMAVRYFADARKPKTATYGTGKFGRSAVVPSINSIFNTSSVTPTSRTSNKYKQGPSGVPSESVPGPNDMGVLSAGRGRYGRGRYGRAKYGRATDVTINIPSGLGKVFTYMGWQCITYRGSDQWKLKEQSGMHFDSEGFGVINGRYVIACTNTYGKIGDYIDFYQDDGHVFYTVMGDEKNQNDAGCTKWGHQGGNCIVEFVVDKSSWYGSRGGSHTNPGNPGCHPEWGGKTIVKAVNRGNWFDDPNFSGIGDTTSSSDGNTEEEQEVESPSIMGTLSGVISNSRAGMVLNSLLGTNNVTTTKDSSENKDGEGETVLNAPKGSGLAMALQAKHEFDEAQKEAAAGKTGTRIETNGDNNVMYTNTSDGLTWHDAWCAAFVKWCSRQTGNEWMNLTGVASPSVLKSAGATQVSKSETKPGDITYDYSGGVSQHTGIVYHRDGNKVYRIDGNYSNRVSLYNDALDTRTHVYYRPNYPTKAEGDTPAPTESNIGGLGGNGAKPIARYGRYKSNLYGRGQVLHTITDRRRTTEGREVTSEFGPVEQLELWKLRNANRTSYVEPPTVPPEWGTGRYGRAATVDYSNLINAILKVLVAIANNTDKLNVIVGILNEKLGINISAQDINNASGNSALLSGILRNSIEIAGLRDGLSVNNTINQTEDNATLNIIAAMNAIASE